ncbi:MAG: hypothetical protein QOF20_2102 [Acidimicrobiaceae bacterium]|jgi:hypothetical protein|nr:hypothetical protein [Acidimicrobiaceae bacterium]MDQ1367377.1 hypothetical protein [Acidimicrobiaceae bacterium]MDQ1369749.1 hypothetical protein [Acidimicrobiaceae bacterium]MDQ1376587.1 hypothetical protein [Acidimicrobiaceae bacterium]MDQ1400433.1 hypothetical protein [Acidimicrobiaceae bacterium]
MYAFVLAGIIAKGLGVIAGIFFAGMILGVVLTVGITSRLRHFGRR